MLKITAIAVQILLSGAFLVGSAHAEEIGIYYNSDHPQIAFAAGDVKTTLEENGFTVKEYSIDSLTVSTDGKKVVIGLSSDDLLMSAVAANGGHIPVLGQQEYVLRTTGEPETYWAIGGDPSGAMYGGFDIAEALTAGDFTQKLEDKQSPTIKLRGMKLNLPFDRRSTTYAGFWSSKSAREAIPHMWDLEFWKTLIDQQARNRYNVLSIWSSHPFPALVKVPGYEKACLPVIEDINGNVLENTRIEQRIAHWRAVMQYAHDRGMKFYFFTWNIHLDYAEDMIEGLDDHDYKKEIEFYRNKKQIDYMNASLKELLKTYPDLDGWGITTGDHMRANDILDDGGAEHARWSWKAIGSAINDYLKENEPDRAFRIIHRSVKADMDEVVAQYGRESKLSDNIELNWGIKYSRAHMYGDPSPEWTNYEFYKLRKTQKEGTKLKTWLNLRNDDYFYFNWGDHQFVRDYVNAIPDKDALVAGVYIGADGYNPTRTYFYKDKELNGQLETARRWYMEMLWGRILYNPEMSNRVFINMLKKRYPQVDSENLFEAWSLASRGLPKVTELIMKNWKLDFHWYPEACYSDPGRCEGFRSIEGTLEHPGFQEQEPSPGSDFCSIKETAKGSCEPGKISAFDVAEDIEKNAKEAIRLINEMNSRGNREVDVAIGNIRQMAYIGVYYAHKIRASIYNLSGKSELAQAEVAQGYAWFTSYTELMATMYDPDEFRNLSVGGDPDDPDYDPDLGWRFLNEAAKKDWRDVAGDEEMPMVRR